MSFLKFPRSSCHLPRSAQIIRQLEQHAAQKQREKKAERIHAVGTGILSGMTVSLVTFGLSLLPWATHEED